MKLNLDEAPSHSILDEYLQKLNSKFKATSLRVFNIFLLNWS
jgi:hypothetical protein